tara:strand:+ start:870 stop:1055 length:186 start_codon:yes stop_codon:yes gene_type:complete
MTTSTTFKCVIQGYYVASTSIGRIEIIQMRGTWYLSVNSKREKGFDKLSQAKEFAIQLAGA